MNSLHFNTGYSETAAFFRQKVSLFLFLTTLPVWVCGQNVRKHDSFDFDWLFHLGDIAGAYQPGFDDREWRKLDVPHDWSIEQQFVNDRKLSAHGFLPGGIGWYRKHFFVPRRDKDKMLYIQFDGVYHQSDIYINGHHLGFRPNGYVSFEYDLTPYIKFGEENIIAVRADHGELPSSRWYSGSGIYRHVWLKTVDRLHVDLWGTYITTPEITPTSATVQIETRVMNRNKSGEACRIITEVFTKDGKKVADAAEERHVPGGADFVFKQQVRVSDPKRWSVETPDLYQVKTTLKTGSRITDHFLSDFGIRAIRWDPDRGFFLNEENIKMKGVNLHGDGGAVGAAVPIEVWERRLSVLKDLGCNAIRCSHNPPAPEFLDLCDRMGFLVIDEALDKWRRYGYYQKYFTEWWEKDIHSVLLRDRNHPSVVLWSVGNEVIEQKLPSGTDTVKLLVGYVHRFEPTRKVMVGLNPERGFNENGFAAELDVVGYNYQEPWYAEDRKNYPRRIFLGTETYCYFRGLEGNRMNFDDTRNPWYDVAENDYVAGSFLWPGIDYLGEVGEWPLKVRSSGIVDIAGTPKPFSGFFKSVWHKDPVVKIAVRDERADIRIDPAKLNWSHPKMVAHWNFPRYRKRLIQVNTFTNCEEVELKVNNRSFGTRKTSDYLNNTVSWWVPYQEGKVVAIGKNKGETVVADSLRTSSGPAAISLSTVSSSLRANGQDVAIVEVRLLDKNGVPVPDDDRLIHYRVTGAGTLIGLDNGDQSSDESFKGTSRTTWEGRTIAIVKAGRKNGEIVLKATSPGLPESSFKIPVSPVRE